MHSHRMRCVAKCTKVHNTRGSAPTLRTVICRPFPNCLFSTGIHSATLPKHTTSFKSCKQHVDAIELKYRRDFGTCQPHSLGKKQGHYGWQSLSLEQRANAVSDP